MTNQIRSSSTAAASGTRSSSELLSELYSVRALFGLVIAAAAVVKPPQMLIAETFGGAPTFWGPLEILANNNREICAALCLVIAVVCRPRSPFLGFLGVAAFLHLQIFFKNLYYEAPDAFSVFIAAMIVLTTGASYAASSAQRAAGPAGVRNALTTPLVVASIVFASANLAQFVLGRDATMTVGGRFSGITSNPQMFTLCLSIIIPTMLYVYHAVSGWRRLLPMALLPFVIYFAVLTGSRLAILVLCTSVLLFYRTRLGKLSAAIAPLVVVGIIVSYFETIDFDLSGSRSFSVENTRDHVWSALLHDFVEHPLLGKPLDQGERLGFGENSFLAAGAGLGIVGFATVLIFAVFLIDTMRRLVALERSLGWVPELSLCFSVIGSTLVGSFFEAVLLGIFTMPLIAALHVALWASNIRATAPSVGIRSRIGL